MDTLMSLRVFCAVAELKSFTAAAERLGLSPAMASKHVIHLENRLKTRLLNRTSRHVSLTETGMLYFNQTGQMIYELDEVEAVVSNATVMPRGTLKLSAPVWIANTVVVQMIAEYHKRYPDVCFDMDLSGQIVNLVDEGFDLALRAIAPEKLDLGYVARPLAKIFFHLVGSPSYLARAGQPAKLADLNDHSMLLYSNIKYNSSLIIDGPNGPETLQFRPVMQSENETMLHMAALEGMGLVFLPTLMVQQDITEGRLKMVLPDLLNFHSTLYAVYPSRKYLSAKVRTFIDFFSSTSYL